MSSERMRYGVALIAVGRATARLLTDALEPTGLKPRHLTVLGELRRSAVTQQSLSEAVGTDSTQLVALLNELESAELITRRRHPSDRRRHIVEISAVGAERLAEAEKRIRDVEERLLAGIDSDEFARLLSGIAANAGVSFACGTEDAGTAELDAC
jgi:DNA-binding MarR family transcriptional regulator